MQLLNQKLHEGLVLLCENVLARNPKSKSFQNMKKGIKCNETAQFGLSQATIEDLYITGYINYDVSSVSNQCTVEKTAFGNLRLPAVIWRPTSKAWNYYFEYQNSEQFYDMDDSDLDIDEEDDLPDEIPVYAFA